MHYRRRLGAGKYHPRSPGPARWLRPISRKEQQEIAERFIRSLAFAHLPPNNRLNFSPAAIAKSVAFTLATDPTAISDSRQPTRGIDVGAHAEIIRLIETCAPMGWRCW